MKKNLLIQIAPKEIKYFQQQGITVVNCDSSFHNQRPGEGSHWLWLTTDFDPVYKYSDGGEENPMTGFSHPSSEYEGCFLLPKSAFWFGIGPDFFGADTKRKVVQVETERLKYYAPLGAFDELFPTFVGKKNIADINQQYFSWVSSLLPDGKTRTEAAATPPKNWPKGPFYDPMCAVARCNPLEFPFNKKGILPNLY